MIKKSRDIMDRIENIRENGQLRGNLTGFKTLDDVYTVKMGSYTCILAAPHHGKSEFTFEIALNQAKKYGTKSVICSPETGSVEDVYSELVHKITGKRLYKGLNNSIEERQLYQTLNYIDEMFSVVDCDERAYSFEELFGLVTDEELVIGDPWNEFKHDMSGYGTRQDLYIEDLMGDTRRFCKRKNKHMIITLHPSAQKQMFDSKEQKYYYGMPNAREAAGGQALFRKAMTWINLWRPPTFLTDANGKKYPSNLLIGSVEKAKPKYVSVKGMFYLYLDWQRNRYYEEIEGSKCYAFDHDNHISKQIQSQISFNETHQSMDEMEDSPF